MPKKNIQDKFRKQFEGKYGDEFTLLDKYVDSRSKLRIRHNNEYCGNHIKTMRADAILTKLECAVCNGLRSNPKVFQKKLYMKYGNEYNLVSKYISSNQKLLIRHNSPKCQCHIFSVMPNNILRKRGTGCPVCTNKKIIKGINDIGTTHPNLVKYFVNKEDAYTHSYGTGKRIQVKCPDCGYEKSLRMNDVCSRDGYRFHCPRCSDGISYPEKFMMNVLDQLGIDYKVQYSPKWIKPKRYDFYTPKLNCIIETHGEQHYTDETTSFRTSLLKEKTNDKIKKVTALANGIEYYIELDCRESRIEWIKNSILTSELSKLLDLNNISWTSCAEFANSNKVKEVCDYWNNKKEEETTSDLSKIFNLDRCSISTYLKKGTKLGWCDYDPKKESFKTASKNGKATGYKVIIYKNDMLLGIFNSCQELEARSVEMYGEKINHSEISMVSRGIKKQYKGYRFRYVRDLSKDQRIKYDIDKRLKELDNRINSNVKSQNYLRDLTKCTS